MGRYTLTTGAFHIQGYEKTSLREIDRFTSQFSNEKELLESLGLKGELWISYQLKGERKLKVAYDDKSFLSKLTYLENKKISSGSEIFRETIMKFLNDVFEDETFHRFINSTKLINDMIKESINNYISARKYYNPDKWEDQKNLSEKLELVYLYLSEYLQFRNLLFITGEYKGYIAEQEAIRLEQKAREAAIEREEEEKSKHQEEFFTPEDYPKHKEYILSHNIPLPDAMKDKIDAICEEE